MAKNTLKSAIAKQKSKSSFNQMQADEKVLANADLSKVIDYMSDREEYSESFEKKGFTKDEVKNAAKFALQAGAYDIDVRHLDLEDSPIYYKAAKDNKKKSRGRFSRKDLDDAGKLLIARAKEVQQEIAERVRNEIDQVVTENEMIEVGQDINEETSSELAEARNMEGYESGRILDDITDNTNYLKDMDSFMEGTIALRPNGQPYQDPARDNYLDIIDSALDQRIPSLNEFRTKLNDKISKLLSGELLKLRADGQKDEDILATLKDKKKELVDEANEKLERYKPMYDAVRKGEMAPEVLKLFLNSALMNNRSASEAVLYEKLMKPKVVVEATPQQDQEYRDLLVEKVKETHSGDGRSIVLQYGNGKMLKPQQYIQQTLKDKKPLCKGASKMNDPVKVAINTSNSFVHFKYIPPKDEAPDFKDREADKRIYITCKPGKEKLMVEAWWRAINANPGMEKLRFKMGAGIFFDRQEKIVVYLPGNKTVDDIMPYLNAFSNECAQDDILESEADSLVTAKKLKPGITYAIEPKLKFLRQKINDGWFDQDELLNLYKKCNPRAYKFKNNFVYSYNMYVNKALILSFSIAKKKLNLTRDDKVEDHKAEMMPLDKKYFADFMKLAGADPNTMDLPKNA